MCILLSCTDHVPLIKLRVIDNNNNNRKRNDIDFSPQCRGTSGYSTMLDLEVIIGSYKSTRRLSEDEGATDHDRDGDAIDVSIRGLGVDR